MPFLSLLWFLTGDLMAPEASKLDTAGPCTLIALVLAAMVGVAMRARTWAASRMGIPGLDGSPLLRVTPVPVSVSSVPARVYPLRTPVTDASMRLQWPRA